jgi:glycosyltransferase involved in cell wall biosynthesis
MRIGLLFDGLSLPPKDGVTYRAYHVAKHLQRAKAEGQISVRFYLGDRGWTTDEDLNKENLDFTLFPAEWLYDDRIKQVIKILREDKIDVLHVCNSHIVVLSYGSYIAEQLDIPLICDMHDVDFHLLESMGKGQQEIYEAKVLQYVTSLCCDEIICMSSYDYEHLVKLGIKEEKLHHIPNGIDPRSSSTEMRNEQKVIFLGNLFYGPNFDAANKIIDVIAPGTLDVFPNALFIFIGRTPPELARKQRAGIEMMGEIDDIGMILDKATVGIAPLFQGSGMKVKLLTYANHSLPIVATRLAVRGYINEQDFLIADSLSSFTNKITWLLNNPTEAHIMGKNLNNMMMKNYSWDVLIEKLAEVYLRTVKRKRHDKFTITSNLPGTARILSIDRIPKPLWLTESRFVNSNTVTQRIRRIRREDHL